MKKNIVASKVMQRHKLLDGELTVYLKDITFLDMQKAAQALAGSDGLELSEYWEYAFTHWVSDTQPELDPDELLRLRPEVGKALSEVLLAPEDLVAMLGFSKPQPTSPTTM